MSTTAASSDEPITVTVPWYRVWKPGMPITIGEDEIEAASIPHDFCPDYNTYSRIVLWRALQEQRNKEAEKLTPKRSRWAWLNRFRGIIHA